MKRILILIYLVTLSLYSLSQRTAEFVSFNQTKDGSSSIYEVNVLLNNALSNDDLIKIQSFIKENEDNFIVSVDGNNLSLRSTPEYTKGPLYASFFRLIGVELFIQRNGNDVTTFSIKDYLDKTEE